jgi:uncharacterized protein
MLFVISPAKSLDFEAPVSRVAHTHPLFVQQAEPLIKALRKKSWRQVSKLMDLSQNLAELNVSRYASWSPEFSLQNAKQAVLAFDGDVYDGLVAKTLSAGDLDWAQEHLCILSGLYGVLRPLDLMQPYRLEMGTTLKVGRPDNLYQYWAKTIAPYFNQRLDEGAADGVADADADSRVIVNLASQEYFKAVNSKLLQARVVECVFEDFSGTAGKADFKVVSFFAKRARGMMARFAIQNRVNRVADLQAFSEAGYGFAQAASTPDRLVFRRKVVA